MTGSQAKGLVDYIISEILTHYTARKYTVHNAEIYFDVTKSESILYLKNEKKKNEKNSGHFQ